jgi:hypothetical protein
LSSMHKALGVTAPPKGKKARKIRSKYRLNQSPI